MSGPLGSASRGVKDVAGHVPQRLCAICRRLLPKEQLVRVVRRSGARIGWCAQGHPRGHGLYFCRRGDCLNRLFGEKKLRRQYVESMEEDCIEQLRALLVWAASSSDGLEAQDVR